MAGGQRVEVVGRRGFSAHKAKMSLNVGKGRVEERRGGLGLWEPSLRFLSPLIERNVRISRITLSDWLHVRPTAHMIGASAQDG